ncbi:unnamed protein product [Haemonchus placei]|uniref:ANF_receptor domain-containing protein n=1 Tax=Haemonchus placei TaxID=6290 RepID=A0A0N4X8M6_HAEPC|nr:unnamed protein product [Haemonchus placei]
MLIIVLVLLTVKSVTADGEDIHQTDANGNVIEKGSTAYQGDADDISALVDSKGRIRIKVGHIGALNALRNDAVVLELSRRSLRNEGLLDDNFDVELVSQNGCGESYEGVAVAADMYHLQKVKVFIGPYCDAGTCFLIIMYSGYWERTFMGVHAVLSSA